MISTEVLTSQLGGQLTNVKQISAGVVRGERTDVRGQPYAVYYFALSDDINEWAENLEQRQDDLIGPSYFETPGDLRWNHYLYLLVDSNGVASASYADDKRKIEADRSYARKFVLREDELSATVGELCLKTKQSSEGVGPDVVSRWTDRLLKAQLGLVLDQLPIAETIRDIGKGKSSTQPLKADRDRKTRGVQPLATKFVDAVDLVRFRDWPMKRTFESLGAVNLIVGSNGVGKTTFLEALEFVYCQENARTDSPVGAHVRVRLKDSVQWIDTKMPVKTADAKQRNLDWYGQRDLRGSTLPNSFARFNFLAADEAAMLGQKSTKLSFEEMLSRIIAGPGTSELWDHITRLEAPLSTELARVDNHIIDISRRKVVLKKLIQVTSESPRASDSDFSSLVEDLSRLRWVKAVSKENIVSTIVPELVRASSIFRELSAAQLGIPQLSKSSVATAIEIAEKVIAKVEDLQVQVQVVDNEVREKLLHRRKVEGVVEEIGRVQKAQQLNAFSVSERFEKEKRRCDLLKIVVGAEPIPVDIPDWLGEPVGMLEETLEDAKTASSELKKLLARQNAELKEVRAFHESMASAIAELRAMATHLLKVYPSHKDCPVCASPFDPGQLRERIDKLTAKVTPVSTLPILDAIETSKRQLTSTDSRRVNLAHLQAYAIRREMDAKAVTPHAVFLDHRSQREVLDAAEKTLFEVSEQMKVLALSGYDQNKVNGLRQAATAVGIDTTLAKGVEDELKRRTGEQDSLDSQLRQLEIDKKKLLLVMYSELTGSSESTIPIDRLLKESRDRRALMKNVRARMQELHALLVLNSSDDVSAKGPQIESAKEAAERFSASVIAEELANAEEAQARDQLTQVESDLTAYAEVKERVDSALKTIQSLTQEESLTLATDEELRRVQSATDSIFRKIHSPNEYGVRRDSQAPLFRLDNPDKTVTLRDISTGQRAAFVLSIFLAMNEKLQTAPPVLLLDDPVAHVDDFNAMSFLDYVRDIALTGTRQIFYATADAKLAGLFEHKFSFLGDKFKRIDLSR